MKDLLSGPVHDYYRTLHAIPETAMQEYKTADFLASELKKFGYDVMEHVGQTGIVAILDSHQDGPVIALRADMDALTYEIDGHLECRHTCGHDAHSAMVLAAARNIAERGIRSGKAVMLFQPGEEPILGALAMIDSGKLDALHVSELYGIHVSNSGGMRVGQISPLQNNSASGRMRIRFFGTSGPASVPEAANNAVDAAVLAIHAINTIHMDPRDQYSIKTTHLTMAEAGPDQIPDQIEMIVDLKHQDTASYLKMQEKAKSTVTKIAQALGVQVTVEPINYVPGTEPSPEATEVARQAICEELGEEGCAPICYTTGGDDFNYLAQYFKCPATYMGLGANVQPSLHHQNMTFDPACMDYGTKVFTNIVGRRLGWRSEISDQEEENR